MPDTANAANTPTMVGMTPQAAKQIVTLAKKEEKPGAMLRISVEGGGCSGFQYHYTFVWERSADDIAVTEGGATLLVDSISLELMKGCVVDYETTLAGASFVIKNPNATARCGCGNSFSA